MKVKWLKLKGLVLKIIKKINDDNVFNLAAALAYFAVFSLAPLLYILLNSLGLLFNKSEVKNEVFNSLSDLIGSSGAEQLQLTLTNLGVSDAGWFQSIIGLIVLFFTATTIFVTIQNGLNYIFRVKPKPKIGILKFFKTRLLAFAIIIGIALILVLSFLINGVISLFLKNILNWAPELENLLQTLNSFILPFLISTILFTIIFRFLPDAKTRWKDILIGAAVTSLLISLGRYLISFYINNSDIASVYDAAGSLMVIFIWMYFSSLIFYVGAVFTVIYAEEIGGGITPEENTFRFVQKEINIEDEKETLLNKTEEEK